MSSGGRTSAPILKSTCEVPLLRPLAHVQVRFLDDQQFNRLEHVIANHDFDVVLHLYTILLCRATYWSGTVVKIVQDKVCVLLDGPETHLHTLINHIGDTIPLRSFESSQLASQLKALIHDVSIQAGIHQGGSNTVPDRKNLSPLQHLQLLRLTSLLRPPLNLGCQAPLRWNHPGNKMLYDVISSICVRSSSISKDGFCWIPLPPSWSQMHMDAVLWSAFSPILPFNTISTQIFPILSSGGRVHASAADLYAVPPLLQHIHDSAFYSPHAFFPKMSLPILSKSMPPSSTSQRQHQLLYTAPPLPLDVRITTSMSMERQYHESITTIAPFSQWMCRCGHVNISKYEISLQQQLFSVVVQLSLDSITTNPMFDTGIAERGTTTKHQLFLHSVLQVVSQSIYSFHDIIYGATAYQQLLPLDFIWCSHALLGFRCAPLVPFPSTFPPLPDSTDLPTCLRSMRELFQRLHQQQQEENASDASSALSHLSGMHNTAINQWLLRLEDQCPLLSTSPLVLRLYWLFSSGSPYHDYLTRFIQAVYESLHSQQASPTLQPAVPLLTPCPQQLLTDHQQHISLFTLFLSACYLPLILSLQPPTCSLCFLARPQPWTCISCNQLNSYLSQTCKRPPDDIALPEPPSLSNGAPPKPQSLSATNALLKLKFIPTVTQRFSMLVVSPLRSIIFTEARNHHQQQQQQRPSTSLPCTSLGGPLLYMHPVERCIACFHLNVASHTGSNVSRCYRHYSKQSVSSVLPASPLYDLAMECKQSASEVEDERREQAHGQSDCNWLSNQPVHVCQNCRTLATKDSFDGLAIQHLITVSTDSQPLHRKSGLTQSRNPTTKSTIDPKQPGAVMLSQIMSSSQHPSETSPSRSLPLIRIAFGLYLQLFRVADPNTISSTSLRPLIELPPHPSSNANSRDACDSAAKTSNLYYVYATRYPSLFNPLGHPLTSKTRHLWTAALVDVLTEVMQTQSLRSPHIYPGVGAHVNIDHTHTLGELYDSIDSYLTFHSATPTLPSSSSFSPAVRSSQESLFTILPQYILFPLIDMLYGSTSHAILSAICLNNHGRPVACADLCHSVQHESHLTTMVYPSPSVGNISPSIAFTHSITSLQRLQLLYWSPNHFKMESNSKTALTRTTLTSSPVAITSLMENMTNHLHQMLEPLQTGDPSSQTPLSALDGVMESELSDDDSDDAYDSQGEPHLRGKKRILPTPFSLNMVHPTPFELRSDASIPTTLLGLIRSAMERCWVGSSVTLSSSMSNSNSTTDINTMSDDLSASLSHLLSFSEEIRRVQCIIEVIPFLPSILVKRWVYLVQYFELLTASFAVSSTMNDYVVSRSSFHLSTQPTLDPSDGQDAACASSGSIPSLQRLLLHIPFMIHNTRTTHETISFRLANCVYEYELQSLASILEGVVSSYTRVYSAWAHSSQRGLRLAEYELVNAKRQLNQRIDLHLSVISSAFMHHLTHWNQQQQGQRVMADSTLLLRLIVVATAIAHSTSNMITPFRALYYLLTQSGYMDTSPHHNTNTLDSRGIHKEFTAMVNTIVPQLQAVHLHSQQRHSSSQSTATTMLNTALQQFPLKQWSSFISQAQSPLRSFHAQVCLSFLVQIFPQVFILDDSKTPITFPEKSIAFISTTSFVSPSIHSIGGLPLSSETTPQLYHHQLTNDPYHKCLVFLLQTVIHYVPDLQIVVHVHHHQIDGFHPTCTYTPAGCVPMQPRMQIIDEFTMKLQNTVTYAALLGIPIDHFKLLLTEMGIMQFLAPFVASGAGQNHLHQSVHSQYNHGSDRISSMAPHQPSQFTIPRIPDVWTYHVFPYMYLSALCPPQVPWPYSLLESARSNSTPTLMEAPEAQMDATADAGTATSRQHPGQIKDQLGLLQYIQKGTLQQSLRVFRALIGRLPSYYPPELHLLSPLTDEFHSICAMVHKSSPEADIVSIRYIVNPQLWSEHAAFEHSLRVKYNSRDQVYFNSPYSVFFANSPDSSSKESHDAVTPPFTSSFPSEDHRSANVSNASLIPEEELISDIDGRVRQPLEHYDLSPKYVFHGTSRHHIPSIISKGFRRELTINTRFGRGAYFSSQASYSMNPIYAIPDYSNAPLLTQMEDAHCWYPSPSHFYKWAHRSYPMQSHLFLCRLVPGKLGVGQAHMQYPQHHCDCLVEALHEDGTPPVIYVSQHDAQSYPLYIITLRH